LSTNEYAEIETLEGMAGTKLAEFEQTIVPHLNAAYNLARWITRNQHDAEDLVQEAYLKAFRFFDGFQGGDGRAWLLAIVRNTCLTWLRKNKGGASNSVFDERLHSAPLESADAEEVLVKQVDLDSLRGCIELLPVEYREVLVMREIQELSYKEIAEIACVPVGTIMSRLSRGRKRLEECVNKRAGGRA
jgi:RNA polymerase sigma-70 factor (ECF subfamily)